MAIDTANKRRVFLGLPPVPDGSLAPTSDRFQMIELYGFYVGAITYDPANFILELATLTHTLTLSPDDRILVLEDSDHDLKIH